MRKLPHLGNFPEFEKQWIQLPVFHELRNSGNIWLGRDVLKQPESFPRQLKFENTSAFYETELVIAFSFCA